MDRVVASIAGFARPPSCVTRVDNRGGYWDRVLYELDISFRFDSYGDSCLRTRSRLPRRRTSTSLQPSPVPIDSGHSSRRNTAV